MLKAPATLTYGSGQDGGLPPDLFKDQTSTTSSIPSKSTPPSLVAPLSFSDFLQRGHRAIGSRASSIVRITPPSRPKQTKQNESKAKKSATSSLDSKQASSLASSTTTTFSGSGSKCSILQESLVHRADLLHVEYVKLLLESLVRLVSVYRCYSYRGLSQNQRVLMGSTLAIKPIELPGLLMSFGLNAVVYSGGCMMILPGTPSSKIPTPPTSTESTIELSEDAELPPLPFGATTARGSGESYYAADDLMTVRCLKCCIGKCSCCLWLLLV